MGEKLDTTRLGQYVAVFVAALILIAAFERVRTDIAAGSLRAETVGLLGLLVVLGGAYWYLTRS